MLGVIANPNIEHLADPCDLFHQYKSVKREVVVVVGLETWNCSIESAVCATFTSAGQQGFLTTHGASQQRSGGSTRGGGALDALCWRAATPRSVLMNARQSRS